MLLVSKINTNETFRANNLHKSQVISSPEKIKARALYFDMNKQAFTDFASGDISFLNFLGQKIGKYWQLFAKNTNPVLDLKAKIIEESIKNKVRNASVQKELSFIA